MALPWRRRALTRGPLTATQLERLFAESPVGIGLSDERGHFLAANAALCRLFGREEHEILGRSSIGFTHPADMAMHPKARQLIAEAPDGVVRVEKRYVRPDGDVRWAWLTITRVDGPRGEAYTLAHVQDVTERKATEQSLQDSEANLAAVASVVRRIRTGEDARISVVAAARDLASASSAVLMEPADEQHLRVTAGVGPVPIGTLVDISTPGLSAECWQTREPLFVPVLADHPLCKPELRSMSGADSLLLQPIIAHGRITGILSVTWSEVVTDVSERARLAVALLADETAVALEHDLLLERVSRLATTDPLTGAPNRRAWDDRLPVLLATAGRTGRPLTVAMLDLDHFKAFNDQWGHLRGDDLLQETARAIAAELREVDVLARWGGEEFVVALPECTELDARAVFGRLRLAMPQGQTCSVGYAMWDGAESGERLVARADAALYRAKEGGRDRVIASVPELPLPLQRGPEVPTAV